MDRPETEAWFAAQPAQFRHLILLEVMRDLTIVMREVSFAEDAEHRWRAAYLVSECNHRMLGYISAVMTDQPHYPEDVIIGILFDYLDHPEIERYTRQVWERAVDAATRFGAHLR